MRVNTQKATFLSALTVTIFRILILPLGSKWPEVAAKRQVHRAGAAAVDVKRTFGCADSGATVSSAAH